MVSAMGLHLYLEWERLAVQLNLSLPLLERDADRLSERLL